METVAQISTPVGEGGISIIKVSGKDSIAIVNNIFEKKDLNDVSSHTLNYGHIYDKDMKIDEVLVSVMRGPNSYTGEDVVEINCHGGIILTNKILKLLLDNGAELAPAGEFTKRAFLNGKKSIDEVNTIMDLISSKSEEALDLAINSLNSSTKELIEDLRQDLLEIITGIEINIDYPEYEDLPKIEIDKFTSTLDALNEKIEIIITDSKNGEILKNGIETVLIGKPNVGKSSILNYLSKKDKAIVTDIEGTTRDILENEIKIGNIVLNLIDTAGIRSSEDEIEKIGIEKSLSKVDEADLVLFIIDGTKKVDNSETELLKNIQKKSKKLLILVNKSDQYEDYFKVIDEIKSNIKLKNIDDKFIEFSAIKELGHKKLQKKIENLYNLKDFDAINAKYIVNTEIIYKLESVQKKLFGIKEKVKDEYLIDLLSIDLKEILFTLGDILGLEVKSDYLDEMFSRFCVGK